MLFIGTWEVVLNGQQFQTGKKEKEINFSMYVSCKKDLENLPSTSIVVEWGFKKSNVEDSYSCKRASWCYGLNVDSCTRSLSYHSICPV